MANGIPSVTSHTFSQVPQAMISRSSFDRSHGYKTTLDASYLVPIYVDEALPGDTFSLNMTGFARMATPIKPDHGQPLHGDILLCGPEQINLGLMGILHG